MAHPTYSLLALWLVIMSVCSAQSTYYVKPNPDIVCPTAPCLTLSQCVEWANDHLFPSNTTLVFLPGDHSLESNLAIASASRFVMIAGNSTFLPKTTIVCNGLAAFVFQTISDLQIHGLEFINCGTDALPTVKIGSVLQSEITNCTIRGSVNSSVFAADSGMIIQESRVNDSKGLGLKLLRSTAKLFGNTFTSNRGGGIESINSTVVLTGSNSFVNNSAHTRGGGIFASGSIIDVSGSTTFIGNRAKIGGGILLEDGTSILCEGTINFLYNTAYYVGGGMSATQSNASLSGQITFVNNSATDCISESETDMSGCSFDDHYGGGTYVWRSNVYLKGKTTFEGNSATYGGGIFMADSKLFIECDTRFMTNSAREFGGGIDAQNAYVHLTGNVIFTSNLARAGGGIFLESISLESNRIFLEDTTGEGTISFLYNSAYDGGGMFARRSNVNQTDTTGGGLQCVCEHVSMCVYSNIILWESRLNDNKGLGLKLLRSTAKLYGNTFTSNRGGGLESINRTVVLIRSNSFMNNSADTRGGGISASGVYLSGSTTFIGNRAEEGGGIYLEDTTVVSDGKISFLYNSAYHGGGIFAMQSNVSLNGQNTFVNNSAVDISDSETDMSGCTFGHHYHGGGALFWKSNIYLKGNTTFEGNSATYSGGGIDLEVGKLFIEGETRFMTNSVAEFGGGITAVIASVHVAGNTTFTGNLAKRGGGIYLKYSSLNCDRIYTSVACEGTVNFLYNTAYYAGGGMSATQSNVSLSGQITFVNNSATDCISESETDMSGCSYDDHYGGGVALLMSTVYLKGNTTFEGNSASYGGGGIALDSSQLLIEGETRFMANSAEVGGGIGAYNASVSLTGNTTFLSNLARAVGGGISLESSILNCDGYTSFVNNLADYGGGLNLLNDSSTELRGNTYFLNNTARTGGGITAATNAIVILAGSTIFTGNSGTDGGGIHIQNNSILKSKGYIIFANNQVDTSGGGLRTLNSTVKLTGNIQFVNNLAGRYGGGIATMNAASVTLCGTTNITQNSALSSSGGGIFTQNSTVKLSGSNYIANNFANYSGGGIRILKSNMTFHGSTILLHNTAEFGGGVSAAGWSYLMLSGNTTFRNNSAMYGGGIDLEHYTNLNCEGSLIFANNQANDSGGGMRLFNSTVTIEGDIYSTSNTANYGGAFALSLKTNLTLNGSTTFINNSAVYGGGIYVGENCKVSSEGNISFVSNLAENVGGGFLAIMDSIVKFEGNNIFIHNTADYGGGAIATISCYTLAFSGNNTFIKNSANYGGAAHFINTTITFSGRSLFLNNSAYHGGGIHSRMVTLRLSDMINFTGNSATTGGGGLSLAGSSQCILSPHTTVYLSDNHAAQYGGAIYITDDPFLYCSYELTNVGDDSFQERCFFQPLKLLDENAGVSVHFILQNNFAEEAGSAVYGGMVDRCSFSSFHNTSSGAWFDRIFTIIESKTKNATTAVSAISSDPIQVCPCYNDYINCSKSRVNITVFPGETFAVHVVAVGQRNGIVPSLIKSSLDRNIATLDDLQDAQSAGTKCTPLQYRVFSENRAVVLQLYADGVCLEQGRPLSVNIAILPCPIAFELSDTTKGCVCEKRLRRFTDKCNITTGIIEHTGEIWVGLNDYGTILHPHCPFDYCKAHRIRFAMNETDLQCNYERKGLLCGDCQPGLSLALGTSRCLHCGNVYLLLLIGFAIAGIALVILILACKLTVAVGTINGLIFYANIVSVNKSVFLDSSERALSVFIAWVNLDFGIETCFYDGMDAYERIWLQFIFPAYVWVLVGIIIILGNRYPWAARLFGRNPVAVLATLFLLSYAKLLNTLIVALFFTYLYYPDGSEVAVWLYNGNIGYLRGKHIPLFIAALLVLLVLFLPYTLFLLLGQWIQARSEMRIFSWINDYRVKSFIDAYHGPFRDEHRYWNGLLLVVRCCLFLVFAFNALGNPNVNLLTIVTSTIMLLVLLLFAGGRIYKNWYLQALDVSYIVNIGILAAATFYVRCAGGNQTALAYVSVGIALLTFIGIMVYHAITQIKDSHVWKEVIAPKLQRRQRQWVAVPTEPPPLPPTVPHLPTRSIVDLSALIHEDESNL